MTVPVLSVTAHSGAQYVQLTDAEVTGTVWLSDSVLVDVDANGAAVGVEVLGTPA